MVGLALGRRLSYSLGNQEATLSQQLGKIQLFMCGIDMEIESKMEM
jgi:hypothetical protein